MHSPNTIRDGTERNKVGFTFRRLAHALWPTVFDGDAASPAPITPQLTRNGSYSTSRMGSARMVSKGTPDQVRARGGTVKRSPSKANQRQQSTRGYSGGSDDRLQGSHFSLSPEAIERGAKEGWSRGSLKHIGHQALRLWASMVAFWTVVSYWVWCLFRRSGSDAHHSHSTRKRNSSEILSDESPSNSPAVLHGLVVPPQGDRQSKKRRNVYYDVEEASYRPMHRLLFMRERSINPIARKKYEAAAASAAASTTDPSAHPLRQLSEMSESLLEGVSSGASPIPPYPRHGRHYSKDMPSAIDTDEYALAMGGDSAQIMLASPLPMGRAKEGEVGFDQGSPAPDGTDDNGEDSLPASEGGYFSGKYGDKVCDGTFILVSKLGSGAFSTVWLAIDVKGATSTIGPALMFRNRMDDTRYNGTAAVMKQGFAFVVLKISRSALPYRQACEKEFETHQQLFLRLQREGFNVDKFLLFPLSLREEVPRGPCHSVQVGAACGPSLLSFVLHAAPTALSSLEDKMWRMRFLRQFIRNAIEGLSQLHSCGILHTDVKPENLLLTLPAYEVLRKMKAEPMLRDASGRQYRASSGRTGQGKGGLSNQAEVTLSGLTEEEEGADKDLIFAKHRLDIINGVNTWVTLRGRYPALMATEESDVVEALGAIKVADLGNAVFLSNVRVAELQLKENLSTSERNELAAASQSDPSTRQQTAQYFQAAAAAHAFQTREYRAPEIIVGVRPLTRMLTPAMDVWSIGCLIFELVTGSYLFNPHAAVQQEASNGIVAPDTEFRHNEVHLSMMQEICSSAPSHSGSATGQAVRTASIGRTIPDIIRHEGRMSEQLFKSMLPIAPESLTGEPLLNVILEQRTFCDVSRKGEDATFRAELAKVAAMLGAIFKWNPTERPSMSALLAMPWLQDDGCN